MTRLRDILPVLLVLGTVANDALARSPPKRPLARDSKVASSRPRPAAKARGKRRRATGRRRARPTAWLLDAGAPLVRATERGRAATTNTVNDPRPEDEGQRFGESVTQAARTGLILHQACSRWEHTKVALKPVPVRAGAGLSLEVTWR